MSRRNKAAALAREVQRRQQPPRRTTLQLVHDAERKALEPTPWQQRVAEAMAPLPDEFRWQSWGFLLPEVSRLVDEPTGYLPVIDFVSEHSFAELRGQVA